MTQSLLQTNWPAVVRLPHLAVLVEGLRGKPATARYNVEAARDGLPFLVVTEDGGKAFTYHSRYAPATEAKKQVESAPAGASHWLLFGMGLGYALEEILPRLSVHLIPNQVFVVEPDPRVFLEAISARDLRTVLGDPRITWCVGQTPDQVGDLWGATLDWSGMDQLAIVEHPPTLARFPAFFERAKEKMRYLASRSKGNLVTLMHVGYQFHSNAFGNIGAVATLPGVQRLFGRFQGVPAVILAAGPSLEKNLHHLRQVQDRFLLIATDTVLRPMITRGLRPHIVCAGDPSYLNSLDFVGVEHLEDVWLAIEPMTHPDIQASFEGPKMVMSFGSGLGTLLEPLREPLGKVICWGSIATTAFDLARQLGCDPIILVGLDLSFQDGLLYIRGSYSDDFFYDTVHPFTSLEHETLAYIARHGVHRLQKSDGSTVFTDHNMHMYRRWFEDQIPATPRTVINATEGGVLTKGVLVKSLEETIREFLPRGVAVGEVLADAMAAPVQARVPDMRKQMEDLRRQLVATETACRQERQRCRKLVRRAGEKRLSQVDGPAKAEFLDLVAFHDRVGEPSTLYSWFSIHQAKFVTRHGMEIKNIRGEKDPLFSAWLNILTDFFDSLARFHEYQLPLLEMAIHTLEEIEAGRNVGDQAGSERGARA
ncbi:MAG: motility associated factor glycosyltransferase family protein [Candidatus Riflebacteria bacterium]|nr:motility associated factor glycosyltransferase family protein [Candidatus Riflebacteria bacterium]